MDGISFEYLEEISRFTSNIALMLSFKGMDEVADQVFTQGYIHSFIISIRGYVLLDLDKNQYHHNHFTLHLNENKIYPHSNTGRTILIRFINSLQNFFDAGTDEVGFSFIMETIGHRSISEII